MKNRRGILIKMFIWFWLVMSAVIAITILIDRFTGSDPREQMIIRHLEILLSFTGQAAVELCEKGNRIGFSDMMKNLKSATGTEAFLFTEALTELQGKPVPPEVTDLVSQARKRSSPLFSSLPNKLLGVIKFKSRGGHLYLIAGLIPLQNFHPSSNEILFIFQRLAIALVISCLACYLLARYLTIPILRLGEAARRLAAGDLKVRISPETGKRWDEIGELAHDFDLMAERIYSLVTSQQQLLGNISHELRSPLARLNVALELARRVSSPEAEKSFRRIEWEAERLNELIGRLLSFTRLEGGWEEAKKESIDLEGLLLDIVDDADFEARSRNRGVKLIESRPCRVMGNNELLRSAIENVTRNAIQYTREGTTVDITLRCTGQNAPSSALIQVRDYGPGVPETSLSDIFRPFYRVASARERQTGGTGLGLAISERALRLHGGTIKASNATDEGFVIEITIPLSIRA
jgi:two-component system, OmpR family, sensor histidine kinase CpxA